jgi:DNA-directed RNA polymerase subunit E'/Rpb7
MFILINKKRRKLCHTEIEQDPREKVLEQDVDWESPLVIKKVDTIRMKIVEMLNRDTRTDTIGQELNMVADMVGDTGLKII